MKFIKKIFGYFIVIMTALVFTFQTCFSVDVFSVIPRSFFCTIGNSKIDRFVDTELEKVSDIEYISDNLFKINLYSTLSRLIFVLKHKTTDIDNDKQMSEWELFNNDEKIGHITCEYLEKFLEEVKVVFYNPPHNCLYTFNGYMGRFYKNKDFILYSVVDSSVKWLDVVAVILTNEYINKGDV